jgi:ribonuclease BN (tRNA processing enzyme)
VELIVLGAAPAYTDRAGSASSSYLLKADGAAILLDLGQGAFSNLASTMEPSTLTAVLVSHLHPDHFVDLVPLRHYLKWEFDPPRRARVLGPVGLAGRLDALNGSEEFSAASLDIEVLSEGLRRIGPFEVEARRVAHTEESYAFRVSAVGGGASGGGGPDASGGGNGSGGASARGGSHATSGGNGHSPGLVYSGDCSRAEDLKPLIRPGDTLLSEASFGAGPVAPGAQHITSAEAAQVASAAGASSLLLTHVLAGRSRDEILAAAQGTFAGPVQVVTEGDRFEV